MYAGLSYYHLNELDYKGQAALVAVSSFSLVTSGFLLRDMSRFQDSDLGKLSTERASLVIGLIFVCIYVPLSIGTTFLEVLKVSATHAEEAAIKAGKAREGATLPESSTNESVDADKSGRATTS